MNTTTTTGAHRVPTGRQPWPNVEKISYLVAFKLGKAQIYVGDKTLTVDKRCATRFRNYDLADREVKYWKRRAKREKTSGTVTYFDTAFITPDHCA